VLLSLCLPLLVLVKKGKQKEKENKKEEWRKKGAGGGGESIKREHFFSFGSSWLIRKKCIACPGLLPSCKTFHKKKKLNQKKKII
jgi:hypothetical protein